MPANVESMFYTGAEPWHGLGEKLEGKSGSQTGKPYTPEAGNSCAGRSRCDEKEFEVRCPELPGKIIEKSLKIIEQK